jgi:hypothetical protein
MLTFGRQGSRDVLNALKEKADAFEKDPLNSELANQCAIDAWSLCDWVFKDLGARLGIHTLTELQSSMRAMYPNLALLQDVANASKHKDITLYEPRLKEAKNHLGAFERGAFSPTAFNVSALVLVGKDDSEIWFDDALKDVIRHWDDYFLRNGL